MPRISFEDVYEAFIPNAFVKPVALPAFLWSHAPGRFFSFLRIPPRPRLNLRSRALHHQHLILIGLMTNRLSLGLAHQP